MLEIDWIEYKIEQKQRCYWWNIWKILTVSLSCIIEIRRLFQNSWILEIIERKEYYITMYTQKVVSLNM